MARAGLRKLVMVNSHGGTEEVIGIVARELRVRHSMMVVKTSWMRFGTPPGLYSETALRYGIHGGDVETSLMLHFRPELVVMEKARDFPSRVEAAHGEFSLLAHTGTHAFAWSANDLNPQGAVGEAAQASAEKGRATALHQAQGFLQLTREVGRAKLGQWIVDS